MKIQRPQRPTNSFLTFTEYALALEKYVDYLENKQNKIVKTMCGECFDRLRKKESYGEI